MKRIFSLLFLCSLAALAGYAQNPISAINISLPAVLSPQTTDWSTASTPVMITAHATPVNGQIPGPVVESRILVTIKKAGARVCGTYTATTAPMSGFNAPVEVWAGANAMGLLGQDCSLPPGNYEFCVQFFGDTGPLSEEKCKPFTIASPAATNYREPQNILPSDGEIFNSSMASQPVLFRWTKVIPTPGEAVTYHISVWKLTQGQTPAQAIQGQPYMTKDVNNLGQGYIINLFDASCLAPASCQFVWNVQAQGANNKTFGANNGTSAPTVFGTAVSTGTTNNSNQSNSVACNSISTKSYGIGDIILLSDDFKMKLTAVPTGTNDSLTGVGTVRVKWLGIFNVKFKAIKVNGQDKLCSGAVYTNSDPSIVYPIQFLVNALNVNTAGAWTINKVKEVADYIKANKNLKPLVKAANSVDTLLTPTPINMPVGYFKSGDTSTAMGFTEMIFRPDYAEFEVIASLNTEHIFKSVNSLYGTNAIALHGSGIKFKNTGLSGIVGSIKLLDPLIVSYSNTGTENLKLTFNKEESGHMGNGIVFSAVNDEFWKYDFDVDVELPKEWLVPVDPAKTNVDMNFQMEISMWNDFILQGSLPACTIPNSNGLGVEAGSITYDHSYITNAQNMVFPAGYQGNTNSMFSGFYMKDFKLTLPDQLRSYADTSKKIQVIAENLIIDQYGITCKINANNVLQYPKANVGNLGASIDTVTVSIAASALTEAKMLGQITLPMSSSANSADAINYSALFIPGSSSAGTGSSITFALKPAQDITSKFLGDGKVQIDQSSSLNLVLSKSAAGKREINFDIDLNGKLYYPTGKILDPGSVTKLDLDLSCNFEHLGMSYKKSTQDTFTLSVGHWAFASPQKKLSGFNFTITDVKAKIEPIAAGTEKQYLFKGGVEFVAKINIGSENSTIKIGGDTKIALEGAIESSLYTPPSSTSSNSTIQNLSTVTAQVNTQNVATHSTNPSVILASAREDYGFLAQLKPKYLGVKVESIHIDAHLPVVDIIGSVEFYKHDAVYGNGFKGELQAKFKTPKLTLQAGAIFGNTKYIPNNTGNGFKYWMLQAQVNIPSPGLPFMTGIAFRGFGAGVYSRMNMTPPAIFNPTTAAASTFGGAIFTPDATVKIGFKAKAIIATTPKEETFNGSVALAAEFNATGGMNFIQFDGLFNCGAKIGEEANAFANGAITVKYDFPNKIFSMNSLLIINKDPISTPAPITTRLYIDSKNNKWYFKSGVPTAPMTVRVFGVDIQSYLMFGNDLGNDIPKGFMRETTNGFASIGYNLPPFSESATGDNKYQSAKGFAFGLGINYANSDGWNIADWKACGSCTHRYLNINYHIAAGGEIDASLLQYAGCTGFGKGWRAKMSIAMYAGAILNYDYNLPILGSKSGELARVTAAAYGTAEFPNPTYFEGQLDGDFSIGGYSVGFHKHFVNGSHCSGSEATVDPGVNQNAYTQENVADSLNHTLIKNILNPAGGTNISRTTNFAVLLNYPYNESFDLEEQQSSGQINVRTFRASYTAVLTQDSTGSNPNTPATSTVQHQTITMQTNVMNQTATANNSGPANNVVIVAAGTDEFGAKLFTLSKTNFILNPLKANTSYRFKITGRLEEKVGSIWKPVKNKTNNIPVVQSMDVYFKTNSDAVNTGTINNSNSAIPVNTVVH